MTLLARRRSRCVLAGALALALAAGTRSADASEDDLLEALGDVALYVKTEVLVAGATRRVARLSEAPGTITVIDGAELREWGALTLGEALRYVTSVLLTPGQIAATAEVRDIEQLFGNKILLLQDGRLLNSVFRGNAFVDLAQPIDGVARIEVVRGPGSALYGANAFAGFVNIITRRGDEVEGAEISATAGSGSLGHLSFLAGDRRRAANWTVTARAARADAIDPVNVAGPNAEHEDAHVALHWGKGTSKGEAWFANASFTSVDQGVPGTFDFPTPGDRLREQRIALDGFRLWEPSKKTKLKLRGYWNRQEATNWFQRADADLTPISDQLISTTGGIAYDAGLVRVGSAPGAGEPDPPGCVICDEVALVPPGGGSVAEFDDLAANGLRTTEDVEEHDEQLGFLELQADWQVSKGNYLLGGVSLRLDDVDHDTLGSRRFENYAVFVEDEQRFLDDELILLGSLRLDDHSYFGASLSPRISVIWSPREELILKTAYGKAFRSPNFVELFGETRVGAATVYGQQRAVEAGVLPESFERVDLDCQPLLEDCPVLETELVQEEISTVELWTEYTPVERFKVILNLYWFEIVHEVGVALDRNDIYYLAGPLATLNIRPSGVDYDGDTIPDVTIPRTSFFAVPGLVDVPTLGVFLNAPDATKGYGAELEIRARPWDWLLMDWRYSRRENERGEVRSFVEASDTSAEQSLVPTFGTTSYRIEQATGVVTFRRAERFWASLRLRALGRPDSSFLSSATAVTTDLTVGWRLQNFTVAGTVLNLNEGGTVYDPRSDDFIETDRDLRLTVGYRKAF
jgi:iron complex outermembrane receptor protein